MSETLSDFERETDTIRHTEAWARRLAKDTAEALGRDYVVILGYPRAGEHRVFERVFVENRLYLGEIGLGEVIACYGADGQEIDREEVSDMRR